MNKIDENGRVALLLVGSVFFNLLCTLPVILHMYAEMSQGLSHYVIWPLPPIGWSTIGLLNTVRMPFADINGCCAVLCHVALLEPFRDEFLNLLGGLHPARLVKKLWKRAD